MVSMVFPKGKKQASDIIISLSKIFDIKLDNCDAKTYYELLTVYSDVLIRQVVTHSTDDSIITSLQVKHGNYIKTKAVAQKTLAYCILNMKNNDFKLDTKNDVEQLDFFNNILSHNERISQENISAQNDNLEDPDYGLVPEKPIYTNGVKGSKNYLNSLRTISGAMINWERRGSIEVRGIKGMVDIYDGIVPPQKACKTLYVNMYGTANSTKAPKGFCFFNKTTSVKTDAEKQLAKDVIPKIPENIIFVLRLLYISYKNNGSVTLNDTKKSFDYITMKEFEQLLLALANNCTLDGSKSYLQMVEEFVCPPTGLEEGVQIFNFAQKLQKSDYSKREEFEKYIKDTISKGEKKDLSALEQKDEMETYICPKGPITAKEFEEYDKALKKCIVIASHKAGISNWFRLYSQLVQPGFNYSQKLFQNGYAITNLMKLPSIKSNSAQAFSVLCGTAMYAGVVSAKKYCDNCGSIVGIEQFLSRMDNNQVLDEAAHILGYKAGNDMKFLAYLAPVANSAAGFLSNTRSNPGFFGKCAIITLKTMFEFGTGLYFE